MPQSEKYKKALRREACIFQVYSYISINQRFVSTEWSVMCTNRGCSYDPTYRDVLPSETNISLRSYEVFHVSSRRRDEITM
jgi:hypothetical protein